MTDARAGIDSWRCAALARSRGDALFGTASPVARWLLVEVPGPWGADAMRESRIDPDLADRVIRLSADRGVRVLAIRRPGRSPSGSPPGAGEAGRRWCRIDSRPGRENTTWGRVGQDADLLEVAASLDSGAEDAPADPQLVVLVCAHAKHDLCCAVDGRPVAQALARRWPEQTWECSHIGGDRFAGNVVLMPHGLYYGRLDATSATGVVQAYEAGRIVPTFFRGRSAFIPAVQAAQHYAREAIGTEGLEDLALLGVRRVDDLWLIRLRTTDGPAEVVIRPGRAGPVHATCRAARPAMVPTFDLASFRLETG